MTFSTAQKVVAPPTAGVKTQATEAGMAARFCSVAKTRPDTAAAEVLVCPNEPLSTWPAQSSGSVGTSLPSVLLCGAGRMTLCGTETDELPLKYVSPA